jgi:hypothetical protein
MVGVAYYSVAMTFYIKKKWLHPVKKPIEGGAHWTWLFFMSDINKFLANDPRKLRPLQIGNTRRKKALKMGKAVQLFMTWKMKCPLCGETVRIKAVPKLLSPEVKRLFIVKYNQADKCSHQRLCSVERPLKPYLIRKHKVLTNNRV